MQVQVLGIRRHWRQTARTTPQPAEGRVPSKPRGRKGVCALHISPAHVATPRGKKRGCRAPLQSRPSPPLPSPQPREREIYVLRELSNIHEDSAGDRATGTSTTPAERENRENKRQRARNEGIGPRRGARCYNTTYNQKTKGMYMLAIKNQEHFLLA